jgi:superfamily II DNA or RNA helicase
MTPKVEFIETDFYYEPPEDEMLNVQQMYQAMREDEARNFLVGQVLTRKILPDDCCLVLGDSLEQLEQFKEYLVDCGREAAFICGTTPKREREKIMADMRAGKYQYLFATYALAKLGLDIPRLNKLVLITPHKDKTTIQQAVGRIMRPFEGKTQPVVYDIYDSKVKQLVYWARERKRQYLRLKCQVDGGPVVRKW